MAYTRLSDANEITAKYMDSILIEERLIDSVKADVKTRLLGADFDMPVMTPAFSHLGNYDGRKYSGSKWLNMIRLEKATELLAESEKSLTEVAMLSGFRSIPSFNRVFHAEKGMAPGEYRTLFVGEGL